MDDSTSWAAKARRLLVSSASVIATLLLVCAVLFAGIFLAELHAQLTYTEDNAQFEATGVPSPDPSVAITYSSQDAAASSDFEVHVSNATASLNGAYGWHEFTQSATATNSTTLEGGDAILVTPAALTESPTKEDHREFQNATIEIVWKHDSTTTTVARFPNATANSTL